MISRSRSRALRAGAPVLVDCLTLWLSNRMLADVDVDAEIGRLEEALDRRAGTVVLVSNEVGFGIVPDNALARRFRDLQGRLNQRIAARADRVVLMVAGLPLDVKGSAMTETVDEPRPSAIAPRWQSAKPCRMPRSPKRRSRKGF